MPDLFGLHQLSPCTPTWANFIIDLEQTFRGVLKKKSRKFLLALREGVKEDKTQHHTPQ